MLLVTGLPHFQGNSEFLSWRKSQGDSGSFDLLFKLRETRGSFDFLKKVQGVLRFEKSQEIFFDKFRMRLN